MNSLWTKYSHLLTKDKAIPLILAVISLLLTYFLSPSDRKTVPISDDASASSVDTFIPRDFALVPLEIHNIENVDSMIGQYAIVDIYAQGKTNPIKTNTRIIRSPQDPNQFAVLVAKEEASTLVAAAHEPVKIILKNPMLKNVDESSPRSRRSIIIQGENNDAHQMPASQ